MRTKWIFKADSYGGLWQEDERHGIVLAKNELAKQFDIRTGEPVWQARRKCPELVIVPPHPRGIPALFQNGTGNLQPLYRFGAAFWHWRMLVGYNRKPAAFGGGEEIAYQIKDTVKKETGLCISVGAASIKFLPNWEVIWKSRMRLPSSPGRTSAKNMGPSGRRSAGRAIIRTNAYSVWGFPYRGYSSGGLQLYETAFGKKWELLWLYARGGPKPCHSCRIWTAD